MCFTGRNSLPPPSLGPPLVAQLRPSYRFHPPYRSPLSRSGRFLPAARKSKLNRSGKLCERKIRGGEDETPTRFSHTRRGNPGVARSCCSILASSAHFYETSSRFNFRGRGKGNERSPFSALPSLISSDSLRVANEPSNRKIRKM